MVLLRGLGVGPRELEYLLTGAPGIDVADWRTHTEVRRGGGGGWWLRGGPQPQPLRCGGGQNGFLGRFRGGWSCFLGGGYFFANFFFGMAQSPQVTSLPGTQMVISGSGVI